MRDDLSIDSFDEINLNHSLADGAPMCQLRDHDDPPIVPYVPTDRRSFHGQ
jgi:hypothetical protein